MIISSKQGTVVSVTLKPDVKRAIEKKLRQQPPEMRKVATWVSHYVRIGLVAEGMLPAHDEKEVA
jgi:hypothetical protein